MGPPHGRSGGALHLPLVAVDVEKSMAELLGAPRAAWMDEPDARYWVENVPDALDQPGEWYLDAQTGWLKYLAAPGVRPNRVPVVAARLRDLILVEGDPASGPVVQGVVFSGITFAETDDGIPSEGIQSPQSAVPVRGAFRATHATDCVIEDCTFINLGGYALDLGRGAQRWRVVGNRVRDIGNRATLGRAFGMPVIPTRSPTTRSFAWVASSRRAAG
jgi:hypothetical protein